MRPDPFAPTPLPLHRMKSTPDEVVDPLGVQSRFTHERGGEFLKLAVSRRRFTALIVIALAVFGTILGRSGYLQIVRGAEYRALGEGNRLRRVPLFPLRGIITDITGAPLVRNVPRFSVAVIPSYVTKDQVERDRLWAELAPLAGATLEEMKQFFNDQTWRSGEAVLIADNVLQDDAVRLRVNITDPGVVVEARAVREYLEDAPSSLAHVVGYMGKINDTEYEHLRPTGYVRSDVIGRTGIEDKYETILRGRMGERDIEVDAHGKAKRVVAQIDPHDGADLKLALDFAIQKKLDELLVRQLRAFGKTRGAAVVMDPRDGSVRALVSLPGFDANLFASGIDKASYAKLTQNENHPLFPRAHAGEYPSGSIIKPIFAAVGLDNGTIKPDTRVMSVGGIQVKDSFFPDWKEGGHGSVNIMEAIAHSVNTFFYYVGGGYKEFKGMGPEALSDGARLFGLGDKLGIDLPSEGAGLIPTPEWKKRVKGEPWYIGDTYHFAIGQGDVTVTPLQMAAAIGAIANGGTLYRPHLLYTEPLRGAERRSNLVISDHVASPESLEVVRRGMRLTVTQGTAQSLRDLSVPVAGKTGTAEWKSRASPHAWFVGFAPYYDSSIASGAKQSQSPEIVIVVLVEQGGEGSRVAAPVAHDFLEWYFAQYKAKKTPRD